MRKSGALMSVVAVLLMTGPISAQELVWRHDYPAACADRRRVLGTASTSSLSAVVA